MRYRDILIEAQVKFTKAQLEQVSADDEYHVVTLTMQPNGDIVIGDEWGRRRNTVRITVSWQADGKELSFYEGSHGEHLRPRVQQAIRALRDAGIIDATWKVTTRRGYGYYPPDSHTYRHTEEPIDLKGLDQLADQALRLSPVSQNLVFYHGTSGLEWRRIQRVGLVPLFVGSNAQHGAESRGKHAGNERVLYLASTVEKALQYAKTRAESNQRRLGGYGSDTNDATTVIVLRVQIPDPARLVADDDLIIRLAQRISRRLWQAKSPEERQQITDQINQQRKLRLDRDTAELVWRESPEGFAMIMQRMPKRAFSLWLDSLKRNSQVGYRGIIPPKFITPILTTR
jgi:hypothetical protein